jgi:flagellar protein FliO/FliZ
MTTIIGSIFEVILALVVIIPTIFLTIRFGGNKLNSLQNGNYLKIIEKVMLSKDNSILVIKIGEKGYVFSSSANNIEMLMEIESEDLEKLEQSKKIPQYKSLQEFYIDFRKRNNIKIDPIEAVKNKLKNKKEG